MKSSEYRATFFTELIRANWTQRAPDGTLTMALDADKTERLFRTLQSNIQQEIYDYACDIIRESGAIPSLKMAKKYLGLHKKPVSADMADDALRRLNLFLLGNEPGNKKISG